MKPPCRAGFSLLEVLIATAILMGSAVVLFQLAAIGTEHANAAEKLADAQWVCQAKLNEILAGVTPPRRVQGQPLGNKPGWIYSVELEPLDEPGMPAGLAVLRVTVAEDTLAENMGLEEDRRSVQFTLTRWIRDPQLEAEFPDEGELR